jgi:hypothetical protein
MIVNMIILGSLDADLLTNFVTSTIVLTGNLLALEIDRNDRLLSTYESRAPASCRVAYLVTMAALR